jgi:hypothetical protein
VFQAISFVAVPICGYLTIGFAVRYVLRMKDDAMGKVDLYYCTFCLGGLLAVLSIFVNDGQKKNPLSVYCEHQTHFSGYKVLCRVQGGVFVAGTIWNSVWVMLHAFDMYMRVVRSLNAHRMHGYRRFYHFTSASISLTVVALAFGFNRIGKDFNVIPFCQVLFLKKPYWISLFIFAIPQLALNLITLVLVIFTIQKIRALLGSTNTRLPYPQRSGSASDPSYRVASRKSVRSMMQHVIFILAYVIVWIYLMTWRITETSIQDSLVVSASLC